MRHLTIIGHFRVAVNLVMKARLSAKFLLQLPRFHNEVHSNSETAYFPTQWDIQLARQEDKHLGNSSEDNCAWN